MVSRSHAGGGHHLQGLGQHLGADAVPADDGHGVGRAHRPPTSVLVVRMAGWSVLVVRAVRCSWLLIRSAWLSPGSPVGVGAPSRKMKNRPPCGRSERRTPVGARLCDDEYGCGRGSHGESSLPRPDRDVNHPGPSRPRRRRRCTGAGIPRPTPWPRRRRPARPVPPAVAPVPVPHGPPACPSACPSVPSRTPLPHAPPACPSACPSRRPLDLGSEAAPPAEQGRSSRYPGQR